MNHLLHKTLVKPYDLESPLQKEKENGWLAFNISFSPHIGLTPEKSWKVSRCVVYRFWQGLCISRALCLTFPAVEPITLQLTTAACCDQKEQLLSQHGGNSMRVPDGGGDAKLDPPIRHTYAQGDTNLLCCTVPQDGGSEDRDPDSARLSQCVRASRKYSLSFAIWVIQFHVQQINLISGYALS